MQQPDLRRGSAHRRPPMRKPEWLKVKLETQEGFGELKRLLRQQNLHTVCEEARCPNIFECWNHRTATFMILGDVCTRNCGFCAVKTGWPGGVVDWEEPRRVAEAARAMGLQHVVITCVDRDDLPDQGAQVFAATIRAVRELSPGTAVEVLTGDFGGSREALAVVMEAEPDIFAHNIETVARLTPRVRSRATYERSLQILRWAKEMKPHIPTKSSIMLGWDETREEVLQAMDDLRAAGVEILTIGQYLQPTPRHLPVLRYVPPEEFAELREEALRRGFKHCEAGPLVRSSYHAWEQADRARERGAAYRGPAPAQGSLAGPGAPAAPGAAGLPSAAGLAAPVDDVAILEMVERMEREAADR